MITQEAPLFALTGKLAVATGGATRIGAARLSGNYRFSQRNHAEEGEFYKPIVSTLHDNSRVRGADLE